MRGWIVLGGLAIGDQVGGQMMAATIGTTRISWVRHGEIYRHDRYFGRLPGGWLGEAGQQQVAATAQVMMDDPPVAVFSSPLLRTSQTAMALMERHRGVDFVLDERLLEVATPFDGQAMSELAARDFDVYTGIEAPYEQPAEVLSRVLDFMREVLPRYAGKHVVAVTHGDVLVFLWSWVMGLPVDAGSRKRLADGWLPDGYPAWASVSTLSWHDDGGVTRLVGASYRNPTTGAWAVDMKHRAVRLFES